MQNELRNPIKGVLFDLDGTLLDTAPDMADALNTQRHQHGLPSLPLEIIRPHVGYGVRALMTLGFDLNEQAPHYQQMANDYLDLYASCLAKKTAFFPHVRDVLSQLDEADLPWGIVTNKPTRFAQPLFDQFDLTNRAACLVCGDTLPSKKPSPDPILFAAATIKLETSALVYVGDADSDVIASQRANMRSLVALYGYIDQHQDPYQWQATGYLKTMLDIIPWIAANQATVNA